MFRNIHANLLESILALLILALCGSQTIKTFKQLYPNALSGKSSQFSPIKIERSFIISTGSEQTRACLGYLEGVFERTLENASYSLSGELYLAFDDKMLPTKVDLEASFNILGQLAASVLKINNAFINVTLGLLNVDPIEISLMTMGQNRTSKRDKLSIPGPILLKESAGEFLIDYPAAGKTLPISFQNNTLEALLDFNISSLPTAKSECLAGKTAALNLFELNKRIKSKFGNLLPQLPFGNILDLAQ